MTARDDNTMSTADIASGRREADPEAPGPGDERSREPLFQPVETEQLRGRWETVQTGFVDEPRHAVEEADQLVADLMQRLAERFSRERSSLEAQWDRGEDISTEDLRVALQRYRSFFDRLLST